MWFQAAWKHPSLRHELGLTPESARVDTEPLVESSEHNIAYYFGAAITESQYLANLFTSTVINHAPFNYWFVIYSPNPFEIFLLIFTSFFNPILRVLLITLLHCHRLLQHRHTEPEVVSLPAGLYIQWRAAASIL